MSIKVERCVASPRTAPAGSSVHRIVSLTDERVAFKIWIAARSRCYEVRPTEGFVESGEMVTLTVLPIKDRYPEANLMIQWAEVVDEREDDVRAALKAGGGRSGHIIHPLNSKNIYDDEQYPSAFLKKHLDPWAELRRHWMVVKSASMTVAIRDENLIWKAVSKIYDALQDNYVMLKNRPMYYNFSCLVEKKISDEIRDRLDTTQPVLYPVLLLIDDCQGQFSKFIRSLFTADLYIFEVSGQEVIEVASSTVARPFRALNEWCRDFAQLVEDTERGQASPPPAVSPDSTGSSSAGNGAPPEVLPAE